jgi:hypothetical protein
VDVTYQGSFGSAFRLTIGRLYLQKTSHDHHLVIRAMTQGQAVNHISHLIGSPACTYLKIGTRDVSRGLRMVRLVSAGQYADKESRVKWRSWLQ